MAHWQPLYHYTILFCSPGSPFITILYSIGPLAVPISLYYTLLAHWQSLYHYTILYWHTCSPFIVLLPSTSPLTIPLTHYYTLLVHWKSLYYSTLPSGPTVSPYISILYSIMLCWLIGSPNINLLYSAGLPAVPISVYYILLAHIALLYSSSPLTVPSAKLTRGTSWPASIRCPYQQSH